jgi:hypothetical protein
LARNSLSWPAAEHDSVLLIQQQAAKTMPRTAGMLMNCRNAQFQFQQNAVVLDREKFAVGRYSSRNARFFALEQAQWSSTRRLRRSQENPRAQ